MNLRNIATLNFKVSDYHCIISSINKSGDINLMQIIDLTEKSKTLQDIYFIIKYKKRKENFNV